MLLPLFVCTAFFCNMFSRLAISAQAYTGPPCPFVDMCCNVCSCHCCSTFVDNNFTQHLLHRLFATLFSINVGNTFQQHTKTQVGHISLQHLFATLSFATSAFNRLAIAGTGLHRPAQPSCLHVAPSWPATSRTTYFGFVGNGVRCLRLFVFCAIRSKCCATVFNYFLLLFNICWRHVYVTLFLGKLLAASVSA